MPHAGMVWYIPSRSSLDAWLQARLGGLQALVGASVRRLAVSGRRLSRRHAMNRPAEKPGRDSTRPSRTPVCLGKLSTANPERVALALCRAWPRLAWPNQGISSCRRRPVRDRAHNHCDPLFAFSLNPEMQRIHNQRSVQCTGDRDGRQETPMGATAPSERPL